MAWVKAVKPPETSAAWPPAVRMVAKSVAPPGMRVMRSASTLPMTDSGSQPFAGKLVINRKARKLVPVVIHRIHFRVVGAVQFALQLQVIGRIGKNQIHRIRRQTVHQLDAVSSENRIERERIRALNLGHLGHSLPHISAPLAGALGRQKMIQT